MTLNPTTVLVADDHNIVRKGLRFILEREAGIKVVAEAADGSRAVALAEEHSPSVCIFDIAMPRLNGIDAASQVLKRNPDARIILLSMHGDEEYVLRALTVGVRAYLLKDSAEEDLLRALHAVLRGQCFFSPAVAQALAEDYVRQMRTKNLKDSFELLTDREREVLQLLAEGRGNKEVANVLNLSPHTVETHRTHIMQKLNLHNTAEIVLYAVRKKIIPT